MLRKLAEHTQQLSWIVRGYKSGSFIWKSPNKSSFFLFFGRRKLSIISKKYLHFRIKPDLWVQAVD